jgi:hypothetical protein
MGKATGEGMSAATGITAGAGALTAVTGAISAFSEMGAKKKIAKEIKNMKAIPLTNIADGMQVSTRGADLQREEQARVAASQLGTLQEGGSRSLIGGIGRVAAGNQDVNARIGANLDEQENNIQNVRAQDEGRIQTAQRQDQANKLAALSSQYGASSQGVMQGIGNTIAGVGAVGNAFANGTGGTSKTKVKKTKTTDTE